MKVKSVLALAAANLGREDLFAKVNECGGSPAGELFSLLRCYNLVENEIALDYFPLRKEEELEAAGGEISYGDFSLAPVEVLSVQGAGGPVPFEARPTGVLLGKGREGRFRVLYTYSPAEKEWNGTCELGGRVSSRLLSFGVCSEFCLSAGQYGEAAAWEKKYREALRAVNAPARALRIRSRRWV